jgi:NAD(P)-dependent dehydrogenase (short-subunit alcohol dehydrogenase family)
MVNLTRQAGIDHAPLCINGNAVTSGFVETDMTALLRHAGPPGTGAPDSERQVGSIVRSHGRG